MSHYRLADENPSAIILAQNSQSGSYEESKIYQGSHGKEVYLKDQQNFAIRFFNPLTQKIGIKITLNGQSSNDYLVLNPGQDVILERFIGEQKKMRFDTYQVDGSNPNVQKAIQNNGDVLIEFFKEKVSPVFYSSSNFWCPSTTRGGNQMYGTLCNCGGMGTIDFSPSFEDNPNLRSKSVNLQSLETGRVEKGEDSNQGLQHVDVQFEYSPFLTLNYKLLPISTQKIQAKEIRNYCPQCGYRVRKEAWIYCPKCGEKF